MTEPQPMLPWVGTPTPSYPPGIFPGLFPDHGALLISGGKEVGKSLIALEISQSAVTGQPLWGALTPTYTVQKVVYIFAEHGGHGSLSQLWQAVGLEDPGQSIRVCDTLRPLVNRGQVMTAARDFYCQRVEGAGLVIFDPLSAFMSGEDTENQALPTRTLINTMEYIANSTKANLLILGHFGKLHYREDIGEAVHSGTRGSSALEHAATAVFYLSKGRRGDTYQVFNLASEYFKGDALPPLRLIRPDDELQHHLDISKGNPQLSRTRRIAGRKGGKMGRNQWTGPLPVVEVDDKTVQ